VSPDATETSGSVWGRFLALESEDRRVVIEATALLAALRPAVALCGVARVQRVLERTAGRGRPSASVVDERLPVVARLVEATARRAPFSTSCLHRSLALWWMLRRRGISSSVQFGARNDEDTAGRDYTPLAWTPSKRDA
jgi:hypothetical protein